MVDIGEFSIVVINFIIFYCVEDGWNRVYNVINMLIKIMYRKKKLLRCTYV